MAYAIGDTLVDVYEKLISIPGKIFTLGGYIELKIEELLGTLSPFQQSELATIDAGIADFASSVASAFSDIPGLAEAIVDYYWSIQSRVSEIDAAYRRGEATLDQLEQVVSDSAYLHTQIALAIVPTSLVKGLMARLGKAQIISVDTARILKAATRTARDISPNPGWARAGVPNLRWMSGRGSVDSALWGQGGPWEDALERTGNFGIRLARNFKAFDFWDRNLGTATSAKTLNTVAKTYLDQPTAVYGRLRLYIDDIIAIRQDRGAANRFFGNEIERAVLALAIPDSVNAEQIVQILRAEKYAESLGIDFIVAIVEQP
jgi:hypothetical protein